MNRGKRIALELLGPPPLGLLLSAMVVGVWGRLPGEKMTEWSPPTLLIMGYLLLAAYIFAGLPSLAYTVVMEWRFARGLNPASWRAVRLSSFLGLLSGGAIIIGTTGLPMEPETLVMLAIIGAGVGFLLALIIKVSAAGKPPAGGGSR